MLGIVIKGIAHNYPVALILIIAGLMYSGVDYAADSQHKTKSHRQQKRLKINPVTDKEDAWTANAETDVYRAGTFENIVVGYSAIHGWDFSLALINTQILGGNKQFQGDTFFNVAKTFTVNDDLSIVAGSQNGLAMVNLQPQLWYDYTYLDNRYDVTPWLLIHAGPYIANAALTGTSRQIGFMTGTEITLIQDRLSLQMDYISGHHSLSGATVNMLLNITSRFQLYMGVSVPEQNSGNEFAGIVGFNVSTKRL
ncbi:hypothetical protein [Methylobacter tundripaludum]|uniref:hypothetical protein n=1 Tax=Methylobacter tundripaludum TaxID=173365 RepID=UPI0004DF9C04|nr:hypothetical protein [Methylobacter tundripaludum]